jgi:hypothetical protein
MRCFLVIATLHAFTSTAFAQEADRGTATRDEDTSRHNGWYVAPTVGMTTVNGEATPEFGLRGAWLINRRFGIGLAGVGWADGPELEGQSTDGGYGGVLFQYVFASESFMHATTMTMIGGGAYCGPTTVRDTRECDNHYGFFTTDSTLNLEIIINENMRATLGGGYRLAIAEADSPLSSQDLRGFVARTSFEVGQF